MELLGFAALFYVLWKIAIYVFDDEQKPNNNEDPK